jgi:hypothetical protein
MEKYEVYKSKDDSGALLAVPQVLSTHRSLRAAVRAAGRHPIFRISDGAEFTVDYIKNGKGWGTFTDESGCTISQNVEF